MIFQTEMAAISVFVQMRFQIIERQIPTDVAVELAVNRAPDNDLRDPNMLRSFTSRAKTARVRT